MLELISNVRRVVQRFQALRASPKYRSDIPYKPSVFNYIFETENKKIGVFNTFSCSVIELTEREYACLLASDDVRGEFKANGFLVPYALDEYKLLHSQRIQSILHRKVSTYRILTTLDCNAHCFYCYETLKPELYMTSETAKQTARFILDHVQKRNCGVQWFGGEPLLNTEPIDIITSILREKLGDKRVSFRMVSNASLASDEIIFKMLSSWKIYHIQVTLDGTPEEYKYRKRYVNIEEPFEVVTSNIQKMINTGICVSIRLNYDSSNYKNIETLIDMLGDKFGNSRKLHVYVYHIFGKNRNVFNDNLAGEEWFVLQNALIRNKFAEPFGAFDLPRAISQCFALSPDCFVITPDGKLFKCAMSMYDEASCVGDVYSGITNYNALNMWCKTSLEDMCLSCCFMPLCQGGCRAGHMNYNSDTCFLQKNFIDSILKERIKLMHSNTTNI